MFEKEDFQSSEKILKYTLGNTFLHKRKYRSIIVNKVIVNFIKQLFFEKLPKKFQAHADSFLNFTNQKKNQLCLTSPTQKVQKRYKQ